MKSKIFWTIVAVIAVFAGYVLLFRPDWLVLGDAQAASPQPKPVTQVATVDTIQPLPEPTIQPVQSAQPVASATQSQTCDQSVDVYCYGVYGYDKYGTPIPKVNSVTVSQPWVRSDGYFNYCYQMTDGSWTTVIGKLDLGPSVYYYGGPIDSATQAPAYADQSEAWCAANVPN